MRSIIILIAVVTAVLLSACTPCTDTVSDRGSSAEISQHGEIGYLQITQEEAQRIMDTNENIIILDVRTEQEFSEGHITGAICIPNETITEDVIKELPDKEQIILVYYRSGRRSKEASEKLASYGYTNIREFGGINDWQGEIEK